MSIINETVIDLLYVVSENLQTFRLEVLTTLKLPFFCFFPLDEYVWQMCTTLNGGKTVEITISKECTFLSYFKHLYRY